MRIYFAASIRGGRDHRPTYERVLRALQKRGEVLTEHIGSEGLAAEGEDLPDATIHDRDLEWLASADIVVAEVSTPSLGVGYEIAHALQAGKPVIALYRTGSPRALSAMIAGAPKIRVVRYSDLDDMIPQLDAAIGAATPEIRANTAGGGAELSSLPR